MLTADTIPIAAIIVDHARLQGHLDDPRLGSMRLLGEDPRHRATHDRRKWPALSEAYTLAL